MADLKMLSGLGYNILKAKLIKKRQPIFLSLFITNKCNLRCKYCFVVREDIDKTILSAEYSLEEAKRVIDEFYALGTRMIYMLGGEPLLHKDIGEIIDYIAHKGIYLHVITNGTLIKKKIDEARKADVLCVSLDGTGDLNDDLRGKGTFEKVGEGIAAAVDAGIPTRVHAVLTRNNLHNIADLAEWCAQMKVALTISPPNFLGETDLPYLRITREEYKEFWKEYLSLYDRKLPVSNSRDAVIKCLEWPTDYHVYIKKGEKFPGYKPTFCLNGYTYVALGAEGTMYNCINRGCLNGPNIHEIGIKEAWNRILEWRPDCVSCASINCIETAMLLEMKMTSIIQGMNFHSKGKAKQSR